MDLEKRIELIRQVGEEIITEEDLRKLLETKKHPVAYDGFEPSGYSVHIAQGLLRAINVNKMLKAGIKFVMYAADWHAWTNLKLGGDLDKIHAAGDYLVEIWKACGMDIKNVKIIRATDLVYKESYWKTVVRIAQSATLKRLIRCAQIMGRKESDTLAGSQIIYPCMQAADVYEIGADITSLGMDQKRVYVLCREIAPKLGLWKPVIVSHHMLAGLLRPEFVSEDEIKAVQELFQEINPLIKNIIHNFKILVNGINDSKEKYFFNNVNLDMVMINGRKYDIENNWEKNIKRINDVFNSTPEAVSNFLYKKLTFIISELKKLNNGLIDPIKRGNKFTIEKWKLWHEKCDKVTEVLLTELHNEINREIREYRILAKMSKSKPDTAIFMTDTEEEIKRKIEKAFCPEKQIEENPILEYCKYILFEKFDKIKIEREKKFGGDLEIKSLEELANLYRNGNLHPLDLKKSVAFYVNELIAPVRKHFEKGKAKELYEIVKQYSRETAVKPLIKKKTIKAQYTEKELKNIERVENVVKKNKLDAEIIRHVTEPIMSLKDHLRVFGGTPGGVLKCLCMVSGNKPLVVIASGEVKIDIKKLGKISNMRNIRMANRTELKELFDREPGGVDALTIPKHIPVFIDEKLLEKERVLGSAGSPRAGLRIRPKDILKVVKAKVADIHED